MDPEFVPGTLPATAFGMPNLATAPPPEQQAAVIEQVKAMLASPDPVQRQHAQLYLQRFGRSFLGAAANSATYGASDAMMTRDPATEWARLQFSPRQYDPGELAYGTALSRAATPDKQHDAEMIGTALSFLPVGGGMARLLRATGMLGNPPPPGSPPGGNFGPGRPRGGPPGDLGGPAEPTPAPASPLAPEGIPPPTTPSGQPSDLGPQELPPGWLRQSKPDPLPKIVEDLRASGREPPREFNPNWRPGKQESAYGRRLDEGLRQDKSKTSFEDAIKAMTPAQLRKLLGMK